MKRIYITFGGRSYDPTTEKIIQSVPSLGADKVYVYDDRWLIEEAHEFRSLNTWLWDHKGPGNPVGGRGFGWFSWKPLIILDALARLDPGDIVLYTDADTHPIAPFNVLYDECARIGGIMLFRACALYSKQWTKRDCYLILGQDEEKYWNSEAGVARFMLFQKGTWRVQQFLMEWLTYCLNRTATTFDPSTLAPEFGPAEPQGSGPQYGFIEHRTEQAIMTLLAHKYNLKLYREACQFGETLPEDKDLYPTLFHQEWANGDKSNLTGSQFRNVKGFALTSQY